MKMLVNEVPWKDVTRDEILLEMPGYETEVDGDKKTVRLYRLLTDVMAKPRKKKKRIGKGKLWVEFAEVKE